MIAGTHRPAEWCGETHEVTREEVMALLDGELPAEGAKAVSRHVEECPTCKEIQQPIRATSAALATWVVPELRVNPQFDGRLFDLAHDVRSRDDVTGVSPLAPFFRRHWVLTAASSALAAGILSILSLMPVRDKGTQGLSDYMGSQQWSRSHSVDSARTNTARSADSNGMFRGLGDHAEKAISVEGQPITDQLSKVFAGPMIARTVSLWIIAKDFGASRAALDAIVSRHQGYAANLSVNAEPNAARSLQASLRVPAGELGAVVAELKTLGRVQNETQSGEEVTQQHADLVARLKNSRETEVRLQDILRKRTGKISDVLSVEQEIARVRGEIEQMEAEQKNLEHRVEYATVDLHLSEEYKAQLGTPAPSISTRFHNAIVSGLRSALEMVVSIGLFFAEAGPSMLIWALLLFPMGWFVWRRWRRSYGLASSASL